MRRTYLPGPISSEHVGLKNPHAGGTSDDGGISGNRFARNLKHASSRGACEVGLRHGCRPCTRGRSSGLPRCMRANARFGTRRECGAESSTSRAGSCAAQMPHPCTRRDGCDDAAVVARRGCPAGGVLRPCDDIARCDCVRRSCVVLPSVLTVLPVPGRTSLYCTAVGAVLRGLLRTRPLSTRGFAALTRAASAFAGSSFWAVALEAAGFGAGLDRKQASPTSDLWWRSTSLIVEDG